MGSNYRAQGDVMPEIGQVFEIDPMQPFIWRGPGTKQATMSRFCQVTTPSWWLARYAGPAQGPISGLPLRVTSGDARQVVFKKASVDVTIR